MKAYCTISADEHEACRKAYCSERLAPTYRSTYESGSLSLDKTVLKYQLLVVQVIWARDFRSVHRLTLPLSLCLQHENQRHMSRESILKLHQELQRGVVRVTLGTRNVQPHKVPCRTVRATSRTSTTSPCGEILPRRRRETHGDLRLAGALTSSTHGDLSLAGALTSSIIMCCNSTSCSSSAQRRMLLRRNRRLTLATRALNKRWSCLQVRRQRDLCRRRANASRCGVT